MKTVTKSIVLFGLVGCMLGCSRKNNTFLSRNWHAVTTEYNTLYNGNLALELGKEELNANYQDNYWNILPVERMQVREEIVLPGSSKNPNFAIAEEKAVKAIQRHSMLIDGRERNPQIDEAYLLLGKARYFDQRFVPALEAFNYILYKYPLSNTINQAKIWREKANMRLEFNQVALKNLKEILEQESLETEERAEANAMLAQAYINTSSLDSALIPIKRAAELTKNKDEKGRYLFIKGQLHNQLQMRDSANKAFNGIIAMKRRTPRVYRIHAFIAKIRNLEPSPKNNAAIAELLTELEQNRENRPFLDKIYFQLAEFHYNLDSINLAVEYYNKSLRSATNDTYLQSLSYETLGNINFQLANYKVAGAYYDSTLFRLPQNTRGYRVIKKKRDNLEDVIYFEEIAQKNDSILYLTDLSETEQLEFFTTYTEQLKAAFIANQVSEDISFQSNQPGNSFANNRAMPGVPNPGNVFYFYNPTAVAYGKQEFFQLWGERPLTDNWRTGENNMVAQNTVETISAGEMVFDNNPIYDPNTYIAQIPTNPEILDSLEQERNFAFYQLGLIYNEKFEEHGLAIEKLELLLKSNPEERLILPSKYNLYKIYTEIGESAKAQSLKNDILYQYPDSRYATILQNPEGLVNNKNSPEAMYNKVYALYQNQEYEEVIQQSNALAMQFTGEAIVPKFELLEAMAKGRLMGFAAYKEALNYVALNYPQSEEGKKAQQLYNEALPAMANNTFQENNNANSFKLVFPIEKSNVQEAVALQKKLETTLNELNYNSFEVSLDVYNPQQIFVVVHGFNSPGSTLGFAELLSENEDHQITAEHFYISSSNYKVVQIHKNVDEYLNL